MSKRDPPKKIHLSDMLAEYASEVTKDKISIRDMTTLFGKRSIAAIILVFALPMALPVPFPGLSALFGIPLFFFSIQLMIGRRYVWLPSWLADKSMPRSHFVQIISRIDPALRYVEKLFSPRLPWMCEQWAVFPIGALSTGLALAIALPIPFGNVVPGIAICLFAIGLMQRDGLAVILGYIVSALAAILMFGAGAGIYSLTRFLQKTMV